MACLFEIYGQNDSAAELILAHKAGIDAIYDHRELLAALVPVVAGKKLPYDEYVRRYFSRDPMFWPPSEMPTRPEERKAALYLAARAFALQVIRSKRGRRVAGKVASILFMKPHRNI